MVARAVLDGPRPFVLARHLPTGAACQTANTPGGPMRRVYGGLAVAAAGGPDAFRQAVRAPRARAFALAAETLGRARAEATMQDRR